VQHDTISLQTVSTSPDYLGNPLVEWVTEGNMSNCASLKEGKWPDSLRSINNLIRNDEVTRLDVLLQTADGGEGDDSPHADGPQSGNIGAGRNLVGGNLVVKAVTAQERNCNILTVRALVVEDGDG
jgi:hypothetical protein